MQVFHMRHGTTVWRAVRHIASIAFLSAVAVAGYTITDSVVNREHYDAQAAAELRQCVAVLNGQVKMVDSETGAVARVTWSKVKLVEGLR
jgi:hypothetical protein